MNLVLQEPGSTCCGQCCVAMVAGITRKKSIKVFGTKYGTTTKAVRRALDRLGYQAAERLRPFRKEASLPRLCIIGLRYPNRRNGHWVVYCDGLIYCPGLGIYPFSQLGIIEALKSQSYLAITPNERNSAMA